MSQAKKKNPTTSEWLLLGRCSLIYSLDPKVWWVFYLALKNTHPLFKSSLKSGSVWAPPAVFQGVLTLQATNLSAPTHNPVRIKKKNSQKKNIQDIKCIKSWCNVCLVGWLLFKSFHYFKEINAGTLWGSKHITYSALITHKTNTISAHPLWPSVLYGFFCERWGQNPIAHSLSNLILGFSFPRLINSHRIDRLGELELTNWSEIYSPAIVCQGMRCV